jgi:hypothetical protein
VGATLVSSVFLVAALLGWCVAGAGAGAGAPWPAAAPQPWTLSPTGSIASVAIDIAPDNAITAITAIAAPSCTDESQRSIHDLWSLMTGDGGTP